MRFFAVLAITAAISVTKGGKWGRPKQWGAKSSDESSTEKPEWGSKPEKPEKEEGDDTTEEKPKRRGPKGLKALNGTNSTNATKPAKPTEEKTEEDKGSSTASSHPITLRYSPRSTQSSRYTSWPNPNGR